MLLASDFLKYAYILLGCIGIFSAPALANTRQLTKEWNTAIIIGSFSNNSRLRYYLQQQLNFVDDRYKFENAFFYVGLGYQWTPDIRFWLMDGVSYLKKLNGRPENRNIIRQQMDHNLVQSDDLQLIHILRLEERKEAGATGWAVRIRQRLTLRVPFKSWEGYSLVLFDEAFFDLNHPAWINSNTFLEQNRAFVGIGKMLSKQVSLDVGYLNQYQMKNTDTLSNVFNLTLNVMLV